MVPDSRVGGVETVHVQGFDSKLVVGAKAWRASECLLLEAVRFLETYKQTDRQTNRTKAKCYRHSVREHDVEGRLLVHSTIFNTIALKRAKHKPFSHCKKHVPF